MKHVIAVLSILLLLLSGCAVTRQPEAPPTQPELISVTSLPAIPSVAFSAGLRLNVLFRIQSDGRVAEVKMLGSSGNADWDLSAIDSMKQWRFVEAPKDSPSGDRWVRNTVIVQVQEAMILSLGELVASSQQEADSLYSLLEGGSDFNALAKLVPQGASSPLGRFIGAVDIARYPSHIRDELRKLRMNDITHPIRTGTKYVIYKRFRPDGPPDLPQ